jgi:predicted acylesterase/phospholipase RssA
MIRLKAGETLIRQGDTDSDYYVLISGRLAVFVRDGQGAVVARGRVSPGESVGEMALLLDEPRSATVVARLDSELVHFPHKGFLNLVNAHPNAAMAIARLTVRRLQGIYSSRQKKESYPTIAVFSLTPGIDAGAIAHDLAAQLSTFGSSEIVKPGFAGLNFSDAPDFEQAARLTEVEERNLFTIYFATGGDDDWSRHCLQRSDLVLFCAGAGTEPKPGLESVAAFQQVDRNLVGRFDLLMVHAPDWNRQCGTQNWIARIAPVEHHHIRSGNRGDLARLGRIIAGTANNLVLSGGGAKSFAQLGALRAFAAAGIPIDRAGGSSMGAFVSALHCYNGSIDSLIRKTGEELKRHRPARDHTLPMISLLSGKRLLAVSTALCSDWIIEDLPLRFFCLSADLGDASQVEHFDGSVWTALRSSCALPGIAPPLLVGGRVLADGGILNNLPIDVMRRHFSGSTIAVDVAAYSQIRYGQKYEMQCPSGFEILRDKLNPFATKEPVPNILEILFRAATLSSQLHGQQSRETADLLITPPVQQFSVTDFDLFDELVEAGYRHTMSVLEATAKDPELKQKFWS